MGSELLAYAIGLALMLAIYFMVKRIAGNRFEVTYHFVERLLIFVLALVLILVAIFIN